MRRAICRLRGHRWRVLLVVRGTRIEYRCLRCHTIGRVL